MPFDNPLSGGVAVLLSTYNGESFLAAQLDSLLHQTDAGWTLFWRDDGSCDRSVAIMEAFARGAGAGRCMRIAGPAGRIGAPSSFLCLLRAALERAREEGRPFSAYAFADQDDVWLPEKLSRGRSALAAVAVAPALYCARQVLADADLSRIGLSQRLNGPRGFPAALAQNVATGCTVMLNAAAARLVAGARAPAATVHDWWCYLVVSAAGGVVLADDEPTVLYRQHRNNTVGAPSSIPRRAWAALRRGPSVFMGVFRAHAEALARQPELLSPAAREELGQVMDALRGSWRDRVRVLFLPGLRRRTPLETAVFRAWFLLSRGSDEPVALCREHAPIRVAHEVVARS